MIKSISIAFLYRGRDNKPANFEGIVLCLRCVASADKTASKELATCHLPLEFIAALFLVCISFSFFVKSARKLFPLLSSTT